MKYREIRERAAEMLERDGWCPGVEQSGRLCIFNALSEAAWQLGLSETEADHEAAEEIESELGIGELIDWNDAPGRTLAEVLAALRGTP